MPSITLQVQSEKTEKIRTYNVVQLREDGKDVLAQVLIAVRQAMSEKITGQVSININSGGVSNIQIKETRKI